MSLWPSWQSALQHYEWIGILIARLSVGTLFALSGSGKLFVPSRRDAMLKTLRDAGIPAPGVNVVFVSSVEFLFRMPVFPRRLEENAPRQGFFEHAEYLAIRSHLPAADQACWTSRISRGSVARRFSGSPGERSISTAASSDSTRNDRRRS